jgi:hypothetical protein
MSGGMIWGVVRSASILTSLVGTASAACLAGDHLGHDDVFFVAAALFAANKKERGVETPRSSLVCLFVFFTFRSARVAVRPLYSQR